jgi:hypothetical protein
MPATIQGMATAMPATIQGILFDFFGVVATAFGSITGRSISGSDAGCCVPSFILDVSLIESLIIAEHKQASVG